MAEKKTLIQPLLQPELFSVERDANKSHATPPPKSRNRRKAKQAIPESTQPFLPGMSRRGRPRLPNPVPPTVRASESRRRRAEAGAKRIELILDADTAAKLESLVDQRKTSRVEVITLLIAKAARRRGTR